MNICVTGGAGYIGSFIVRRLCELEHRVTVVDDLSKGHIEAVNPEANFIQLNCGDRQAMADLLAGRRIDAVVHMAASSLVGESVSNPAKYYRNNVAAGLALLEAMVEAKVPRLVFSSSAAVYGMPESQPITEEAPTAPINPYGRTKLMFEQALADHAAAYGIGAVCLRYFNVAGALPDGTLGEDHSPETHLIPLVLRAMLDRNRPLTIFGNDYPTADGTCIRDYIHVLDLADAHVLALEAAEPGVVKTFNLGNGSGFSVQQVVEAAGLVVGGKDQPDLKVPVVIGPRRAGDPPVLIASSKKAQRELGWEPVRGDLEMIIDDAWAFQKSHPNGY